MPRLLEPNYTEMNIFVNAPALAMYTLTPNQNTHARIHAMATAISTVFIRINLT